MSIRQLRDTIIQAIDDFEKIKSMTDNEDVQAICNEWLEAEQTDPSQTEMKLK